MEINKRTEWNPWWERKEAIEELKGTFRPRYDILLNSVNIKEITIITGVRRSGKSTLMYQMIDKLLKNGIYPKQILFINLEDKKLIKNSLEEIYDSYRENINLNEKAYIFLDEIHKKDKWELWIRKKYDLKTKDKFIISGSCSYLLKKEYSTLLTGRNLTFEIYPLSFEEFLSFNKVNINKNNIKKNIILKETKLTISKYLKEYLNFGGFPEVFFKPENYKMKILEQYFDDIIYKDIIDRYNLNSQIAKNLALFLITNFTKIISLRNLRSILEMSYDTIKDYISYFIGAYLFFTINYFSYSLKIQQANPKKIYCIDNGLRNAVSFKFSKDLGKLAENLVFIELKRKEKEVFYWKKKGEVDFVIKNKDQSLNAINITYTNDIKKRETESLLEFKREFKKAKKLVILTKDLEKNEIEIEFIPLWKWLLLNEA